MKKGFLLTLVILAVALLSTSAYGVTLTITEIPDILIGDEEENTTIDNNFFIFTDVFNLDDKVSFSDSSVTSIPLVSWSFIEYAGRSDWQSGTPASENWISINDIQQNPGSIWTPGAYELRAAAVSGSRADFRNIQVSPGTGLAGALPYDDPTAGELVPRFVDLVAAYSDTDEGTSDTEDIVVALADGDFDHLSEVIVYQDDEFGDHSTPSWTWFDLGAAYPTEMPAAASAYEETASGNGDWALAFATNNTVADGLWGNANGFAVYGLWQMPAGDFFDWTPGKVYNTRWSMVTDTGTAVDQPNWRTRYQAGTPIVSSVLLHQTTELGGETNRANPISINPASPSVFEHLWYPPQYVMSGIIADSGLNNDLTKIGLAIEMLDKRPASVGKIWIAQVVVLEEDEPAAGTQIYSAPPFTETDFTELLFAVGADPHDITTAYGTQLSIAFAGRTGQDFRMASIEKPSGLEDVEARTYRLTAQVSSGASDILPVLRLRLQTSNIDQQAQQLITSAQSTGILNQLGVGIPGTTAQEIVTYLKVANFVAGEDIQFAIDAYGGAFAGGGADPYDGTYTFTGLTLEKLN